MSDVAYIGLTVLVFVLIGLAAKGGRTPVSVENIVGLIVVACLVIYLVICLIFPEKF